MAEIKIERKKSGIPMWALLLALIVLALLVWAFVSKRTHTTDGTVNDNTASVIELSAPAPVQLFVPATRCA
jgi:multidrug resistance efflux pump